VSKGAAVALERRKRLQLVRDARIGTEGQTQPALRAGSLNGGAIEPRLPAPLPIREVVGLQ